MQIRNDMNSQINFNEEQQSSLRDVLYVIFRRKWKMTLFFVVVVAVIAFFTNLAPEIYQSDAKLLIRAGRENLSIDPSVVGPTLFLSQNRENEVNSELSILKSHFLAEKVVNKIGAARFLRRPDEEPSSVPLQEDFRQVRRDVRHTGSAVTSLLLKLDLSSPPSPHEQAINNVMRNLDVEVERDSNIINVSFQAQDPQLARDALDSLLEFYLEHHIAVYRTQASPEFFKKQSERLLEDLVQKEGQIEQFSAEHGIASIDTQKDLLLSQISSLQQQIDDVASQIRSSEAKIAKSEETLQVRLKMVNLNTVVGKANAAADTIKARYLDLRLREADLAAKYPDDNRMLTNVREQIQLAESALAGEEETHTEMTTAIDPNYQAIELALETERAQLLAHIARKETLTGKLSERTNELANLVDHGVSLARLQRDFDILENDYLEYRDNLQRANISTALDMDKVSNVSIVQPATMPMRPVKPNKMRNIAVGVFLALFGAIGLAFFLEYVDHSMKMSGDVEKRLGLPVLASVSYKGI